VAKIREVNAKIAGSAEEKSDDPVDPSQPPAMPT
jgi:hypothetical protein